MIDSDIDKALAELTEEERAEALKILGEISAGGESESLQSLYDEDFDEIPVDIDTFLEDEKYAGKTTNGGTAIYPYWRERLREMFNDVNKYQEVALTGCLSGDTVVPLLNGKKLTMRELSNIDNLDEYVYSFDVTTNMYVAGHLVKAFSTGIKDTYKITLDNGDSIIATSNHKFMTRDKHWKSIDSGLSVGDSMMPLYRGTAKCGNGYYETIKHPQKDGSFVEEPTHRMVSERFAELNKNKELNIKRQIMKAVKISNLVISNGLELNEENYNSVKLTHNMRSGYPSYNSVMKYITNDKLYEMAKNYNHKILSIEYIGKQEVFDLTVEKYHNFALECGIVAHNSIGTGKSTIACYGMAYLLYRTMCLKDPQKYYRLASGSTIVFAFFNNTLDLSSSVGYGTVQNIVQNSPWFMERGTVSGSKNLEYVPSKLIRFRVGSTASHALGTNIISAMLDEVSFKQGANVIMEKSKIMETYNGVLERMGSRFMVNGKIAGKLFIVSSKKSEYDFLENYIRKQKDKPGVMVCDARLWEVKPSQTYCGKTFNVAVGGSNRASKIIQDDEDPNEYMRQGFEIIDVPIEFRNRFELDIQASLMNIAGISISNSTRFISYDNLAKCYHEGHINPFTMNTLTIGMKDKLRLQDFFKPELVAPEIYSRPIFIHLDLSLTGDKTGIGAVAVMGYKSVNEYSIESAEVETTKELYYHHIFSCRIQCPSSDEISLQKTRDFLYYLKYHLGWNIRGVSTDGFQSADMRQCLVTMGFENVDLVSLDKKPDGYITYKTAINEQRISHLHIPELEYEIINLARDNQTGKVDHDVDKCFTGDTKVKLVDGRDLTILELMQEQEYKTNWVYTINEDTLTIEPKPIKKVFQTMITKELIKVTLDNGESVTCTPNHRFMLCDGTYIQAHNLTKGTSLMVYNEPICVSYIKHIEETNNVYDLEITDNHNFALSCGIFVHNSKDEADGIAGAVYNASLHEQELNLYLSDSYDITLDVNEETFQDNDADNILNNLVTPFKVDTTDTAGMQNLIKTAVDNSSTASDDGFFFL